MSVLQCKVKVFSMDFNPHCVQCSDASNSGCLCDFRHLASGVKNGTLQYDRRAAMFLGLLSAMQQHYDLNYISIALMGTSVGRSLTDSDLQAVAPGAAIGRFPHTTPNFHLHPPRSPTRCDPRQLTTKDRSEALHSLFYHLVSPHHPGDPNQGQAAAARYQTYLELPIIVTLNCFLRLLQLQQDGPVWQTWEENNTPERGIKSSRSKFVCYTAPAITCVFS